MNNSDEDKSRGLPYNKESSVIFAFLL
jgi:hypothetical protein